MKSDAKVNASKNSNVQNYLEMGDYDWFCSEALISE